MESGLVSWDSLGSELNLLTTRLATSEVAEEYFPADVLGVGGGLLGVDVVALVDDDLLLLKDLAGMGLGGLDDGDLLLL